MGNGKRTCWARLSALWDGIKSIFDAYLLLRLPNDPQDRHSQRGQALVEYALIIALVAIAVFAALMIFGTQIGDVFSKITAGM